MRTRRDCTGIAVALLVSAIGLAGCRGMTSKSPPIHPNQNMDMQEKFDPQEANPLFADGRAMRQPVPGTVARGMLKSNAAMDLGRDASGAFLRTNPVPLTAAFLDRGEQRYNIYCAPCHGEAGDGLGVVMTGNYGFTPAPTYHDDRLRSEPDGHFYDVISNGIRSMPAYGYHVPVNDRWAIVAYIRALQRSQNASSSDVPANIRANMQDESPNVGITE